MVVIAGKEIGNIAYGLMGLAMPAAMTKTGKIIPDEEIFAALKESLAQGVHLWNGGEFYGTPDHNSLTVLRKYFDKYPEDAEKVVLSIKGGLGPDRQPKADAASIRASVENCIRMLGDVKKIDIFEPARIDRKVSVEETFGELAKLVQEGKIGSVSISEAGPESLRRAAKVTKLEFIETEVNMFEGNIWTEGIAEVAAELKIPVLAYAPLGRGWLSGSIKTPDDLSGMQRNMPRYQGDAFKKNVELVEKVKEAAANEGVTPAQYAIAWVKSRSELPGQPTFIALPGASSKDRVAENLSTKDIPLERFKEIDAFLKTFTTTGARYAADQLKNVNG